MSLMDFNGLGDGETAAQLNHISVFQDSATQLVNSGGHELLIIHAVFMIFAWVFLSAMGLFCARHLKPLEGRMCMWSTWLASHQFFMILTWLLSIAAFVVIFVYIDGWETSPHSIIGVITFGLAFIHPILACIQRPRKGADEHKRLIFGYVHMIGGIGVHIGALVAINKAYSLDRMRNVSRAFEIVFAAFCGVHVVCHLIVGKMNRPNFNQTGTKIFFALYTVLTLCFATALIVLVAIADFNVPTTMEM